MASKSRPASISGCLAVGFLCCWLPSAVQAQSIEELRDMSISGLSALDVTSVTKSAAALGDTPASLYVITHDDIVRSGNITLPGMLRIAPNLQVMRGSNGIVAGARGLGGNQTLQNFSNKLLVMIDGRSVYSPLYSGVFWDVQDILPEDVERIEVLSGPGATLWGANAVNGVINVITRDAGITQGLYGTVAGGNRTYDLGLRYGGRLNDRLNYRVFAKRHQDFESSDGANDDRRRTHGGFRIDWDAGTNDAVMIQADAYAGSRSQGQAPDEETVGYDILARWQRSSSSGSRLQVQAYYDHAGREILEGAGRLGVDTLDLDIQHSFPLGERHSIVWGGGARRYHYRVHGIPNLDFVPNHADLFLANIFVQDSVTIAPKLTLTGGLKLERGPYGVARLLPSGRIAWKSSDTTLLWAAVSRAIRSPTPFDKDVREYQNGALLLTGDPEFRSEKLIAYEAGLRLVPTDRISFSISGFYNDYDDLRSIELTNRTALPLRWGNEIAGHTYGFDSWADVRLSDWWRLKPGYSLLLSDFGFKEGATALASITQVGNDPKHRVTLRTSMDLGPQINFDADLRYVSALPDPYVPGYIELGARVGWQFHERAEISISGFNLLHDKHQELPLGEARPVGRSVFAALKWTL
jgi:iron complex outermembrane receptor protein